MFTADALLSIIDLIVIIETIIYYRFTRETGTFF